MNNKSVQQTLEIDSSTAVRRENAFNIYINLTQFGYTKWDIQMVCGLVTISRDKTRNYAEELGVITMSPEHAKAVLLALQVNISGYEAEHGEITIPKDHPKDALASAVKPKNPAK